MSRQYIYDERGTPVYVVIPVKEYETLTSSQIKHEEQWESIPYEKDEHDDETIPNDVVGIMLDQDVSLQAAWRVYRGLSQYEVAERLGTTQSAVSQLERVDSRPQSKTRERLAKLYECRPEQLVL